MHHICTRNWVIWQKRKFKTALLPFLWPIVFYFIFCKLTGIKTDCSCANFFHVIWNKNKIDKSNQGDWPWNNKLKPIVQKNTIILFWYCLLLFFFCLFVLLITRVVQKAHSYEAKSRLKHTMSLTDCIIWDNADYKCKLSFLRHTNSNPHSEHKKTHTSTHTAKLYRPLIHPYTNIIPTSFVLQRISSHRKFCQSCFSSLTPPLSLSCVVFPVLLIFLGLNHQLLICPQGGETSAFPLPYF